MNIMGMSARVQRRLQWWKEKNNVENNVKNEPPARIETGKKRKDGSEFKHSTNLNKGFKITLSTVNQKRKFSDSEDEESSPKKCKKAETGKVDRESSDSDSESSEEKSERNMRWKDIESKDPESSRKKKKLVNNEPETQSISKQSKSEKTPKEVATVKKPPKAMKSDDQDDEKKVAGTGDMKQTEKKGNKKYVLFVGNLCYRAQKHHIEKHFSKCNVTGVRLLTDKETKRSRGFAYIELQNGKGFKQALLLHHSELLGREINVEFTTIGGGKSKKRAEKLREKNQRCERFKVLRAEEDRYSNKTGK